MPVVIGGKPESHFGDPIGLLADCHRRIERFLSVLVKVGEEALGAPLNPEQRSALEVALRYFREAAPKHTADEEDSLFPRLRSCGRPEVQAALDRVQSLERDHERAGSLHAEVDRLGGIWLSKGHLTFQDATLFSKLLSELGDLYRAHIAIEEGEVFPLAAGALPPEQRTAIGREMAVRRGLNPL